MSLVAMTVTLCASASGILIPGVAHAATPDGRVRLAVRCPGCGERGHLTQSGSARPACRVSRRATWALAGSILATACAGVLVWVFPLTIVPAAVAGVTLSAIALVDLCAHRVPSVLVALLGACALLIHTSRGLTEASLQGGVTAALVMGMVFVLGRLLAGGDAFGAGDVTLSAGLGLLLGFPVVFEGLAAGILLGGAAAVVLLVRRGARTAFAYAPYLIAGSLLVVIALRLTA